MSSGYMGKIYILVRGRIIYEQHIYGQDIYFGVRGELYMSSIYMSSIYMGMIYILGVRGRIIYEQRTS